jgi:hypothetical protein
MHHRAARIQRAVSSHDFYLVQDFGDLQRKGWTVDLECDGMARKAHDGRAGFQALAVLKGNEAGRC